METTEALKARIIRCMNSMKEFGFSSHNASIVNDAARKLLVISGETLINGKWVKVGGNA